MLKRSRKRRRKIKSMPSEAVQLLPDGCVDADNSIHEDFVYTTEKPHAGVVCFAFIVWKLDLIVACAVWRICLLLYMHVETLNSSSFAV